MILLDLKMPGVGERQVYERIYRQDPVLAKQVVSMTGDIDASMAWTFLDEMGFNCLEKPFHLEELSRVARRVLEGAG